MDNIAILVLMVGLDILLSLGLIIVKLNAPEPLSALYFDFFMHKLKNQLTEIAEEQSEEMKKQLIDKMMHNYLQTRDLINKKNKEK